MRFVSPIASGSRRPLTPNINDTHRRQPPPGGFLIGKSRVMTRVETGRTKPCQITAAARGDPVGAETVAKTDERYFSLQWFPTPDDDEHWVQARLEQIKAIQARTVQARRTGQQPIRKHVPPRIHTNLQQAFPDLIPSRPYCADRLEEGLLIRSKQSALRRRHVQLNSPACFTWMPLDLDRPDAADAHDQAGLPQPNVIVVNRENGHAHAAYLLATPVARHVNSRIAPLRFYGAVERGLARRLGADRHYAGLIIKNPLHADWTVEWRRDQPYTLPELARWLSASDMALDRSVPTTLGAGRNVTVFEELRAVAYREVLRFKRDDAGTAGRAVFQARMEAVALDINMQFLAPLRQTEVRAIAKSVSKWTWSRFSQAKFSRLQSHRAQSRTRRHLSIIQEMKNACT